MSNACNRVNRFLTAKLREYALRLRSMVEEGTAAEDLARTKGDMLGEVFKVCCALDRLFIACTWQGH